MEVKKIRWQEIVFSHVSIYDDVVLHRLKCTRR